MAASILASNKGNDTSASINHVITMPDDYAIGDLLLVCFGCYGTNTEITVPSGWLSTYNYSIDNAVSILAYKIAESTSESLTISTDISVRGSYMIFSIIDYGHVDDSYFNIDHSITNGYSTNADPDILNASYGTNSYLWLVFMIAVGTTIASAVPTNFTTLYTQQASTTESVSISFGERTYSTSSLNPDTFTNSICTWLAITIAVAPEILTSTGIGFSSIGIVDINM